MAAAIARPVEGQAVFDQPCGDVPAGGAGALGRHMANADDATVAVGGPVSTAHGATVQEGFQFVRRQLTAVVDQPAQDACLVALGCIDTPEPDACAADVDGVGIDDMRLTFDDGPVRPGLPYAHIFSPSVKHVSLPRFPVLIPSRRS